MLYTENQSGFTVWDYGPIEGIRHPKNIESLWTAEELAVVSLYKLVDGGTPEGMKSTGSTIQRVNGVVTRVHTHEVIPDHERALAITLSRAQLRNMFVEDGKPANYIKTLVSAMPAGKPRERAIVMLEDVNTFPRDHTLLTKIVAADLYTDAQLDTMWVAAGVGV